MISKIILLLGALCAFTCYGQTYSYSFNGPLSQQSLTDISEKGSKFNHIKEFKVRYKEDSERGEIFIVIDNTNELRAEADGQFNLGQIKALLIQFDLEPISFRRINQ